MIVFILLLMLSMTKLVLSSCPTATVYNSNSNMCYKYSKDVLSFVEAESTCNELNGHLASIQNAFINMEVQSEANTFYSCTSHSDYWLGGSTIYNSTWTWTDESPWRYTNMAPGQPSSSSSPQCLSATISDGRWYSSSCDVMKAYICEIPDATPSCPSAPTQPVLATCPAPKLPCDDGWTMFSNTGYCYSVFHNQDFWGAQSNCSVMGSNLVSIHSYEENQFVLRLATTGIQTANNMGVFTWTGLHQDSGVWKWTDGSVVDYQLWRPESPCSGCGQCVIMLTDVWASDPYATYSGKWINLDCGTIERAFVCKKKAHI